MISNKELYAYIEKHSYLSYAALKDMLKYDRIKVTDKRLYVMVKKWIKNEHP